MLKLEVQNLRELTPMKLREYFLSVRTQLEEYNDKLRQELETINEEIKRKDSEISRLIAAHPGPFIGGPSPSHNLDYKVEALMRDLRGSKEQLEVEATSIAQKLESLKHSQISINSSLAWDHD